MLFNVTKRGANTRARIGTPLSISPVSISERSAVDYDGNKDVDYSSFSGS
jgi:hypothetical protein